MADYITPPIGSKGKFSFKSPFDTVTKADVEYTVYSIRSLKELIDSGEDPLKYIYQKVSLTADDMNKDLENNIPIVVLSSSTNSYDYIPANRITSLPEITNIRYRQKMIAINVGYLPVDYNMETVKETIIEAVKEMTGIESTVQVIDTSAIKHIAEDKHKTYMKLLEGKKTSNASYRTRYKILDAKYNKLKEHLDKLEKCFVTNNPTGFMPEEDV